MSSELDTRHSAPSTQHSASSTARRAAVIVAAGRGTRMGQDKVWLPLGELPVVAYSLKAFADCPAVERLVLVVSRDNLQRARELVKRLGLPCLVAEGGARRQDSVLSGLSAVGDLELVALHDGARPLVTPHLIDACYQVAEREGAAIAAVRVRDTVKRVDAEGWVVETLNRSELWAAQTPQVFRTSLIRRAYQLLDREVTDDAAAVEALGEKVAIVPGDPANLKLTTPEDLVVARALLERSPR